MTIALTHRISSSLSEYWKLSAMVIGFQTVL